MNVLKKFPDIQKKWLMNQFAKETNDVFLDREQALKEYNIMEAKNHSFSHEDFEEFLLKNLSKSGIKKIIMTIRVHSSRLNSTRLQTELKPENKSKLDQLAIDTGKSKKTIINMLIEKSSASDFK